MGNYNVRFGSGGGDVGKHLSLIRHSLNDQEGVLKNILYPIQLNPNDHTIALARSLENIHLLVGGPS